MCCGYWLVAIEEKIRATTMAGGNVKETENNQLLI